ncbi:MAG: AAA family ATPase [Spirochaetia bacterium]|nr:AAA family ATPase [Spirochaetia bacterium]
MLLKKIRMIGFKSFADETIFELEEGITAVVGPNGCGKSNILDAVRWVLGEKSARGLRAKSMDDVIFLGSENRKPAGMAEVEIIFNNKDRILGVDLDEVSVGRRIYLNSASEYLLNGKKTTRKEIEQVFMDTGIGKTAYSIMEQGRMAEILSASPDDRRKLFDEAAGVSRFKAEREETLARLHDTDQNLLRLNDILKSKNEEMENLERQAKKTREYIHLKEKLDEHHLNLNYISYRELSEKKRKIDERLLNILKKRDDVFEKLSEREASSEKIELELQEQVQNMHQKDREFHQDQSRMESIQESLERITGEIQDRVERQEGIEQRKKTEEKLNKDIEARLQASMQMELDLDSEIKTLQDAGSRLGKSIEVLSSEIQESQGKEEENHEELQRIEKEHSSLLEELKNVTREIIQELESKKKDLAKKEDFRKSLKDAIENSLSDAEEKLNSVSGLIGNKEFDHLQSMIAEIKPGKILRDFSSYEEIESEFRSILFARSGHLAKKEELDAKMDELRSRKEFLIKENGHLIEKRKINTVSLEKEKNRKVEVELQIRDFQVRRESSLEAREGIAEQLKESADRIKYYSGEISRVSSEKGKLVTEQASLNQELDHMQKNTLKQTSALEAMKLKIEKTKTSINDLKEKNKKDRELIEKIIPEIGEMERAAENISVQEHTLQEELYNDFQISPGELEDRCSSLDLNKSREESEYRRIKSDISNLGQFNALAIEELDRSRESCSHLKQQEDDIQKARKNIISIIDDIDQKSRARFRDTFERIQNNFSEIFQSLFGGGRASLSLVDTENPMTSGIDIMVQPPGKKNRSISLLSGGEKNMTAIALMFATYLVRPSPFCFLDEIDAPLDESNVSRFLKMLSGFAGRSQFLVITHNKQTMTKSQAIFGVTQEEAGVSKIVSVRLSQNKETMTYA